MCGVNATKLLIYLNLKPVWVLSFSHDNADITHLALSRRAIDSHEGQGMRARDAPRTG